MQTLGGRTCVFTGASGGDGAAAVRALCEGGMNVVMITHQSKQAEALAGEVNALAPQGRCAYKVEEGQSLDGIMRAVYEEYGSIDVVISNTGADGHIDTIEEVSREQLVRSIDHLVGGSFEAITSALPYLKESKAARVILMTTVEARTGGTHESFVNAVAKGGVLSLALNAAARLGALGITVNCIAKGALRREGRVPCDAPKPEDLLSFIPLGRVGTEEDLAQAICYLASEESSFINGQVLNVCGGLYRG